MKQNKLVFINFLSQAQKCVLSFVTKHHFVSMKSSKSIHLMYPKWSTTCETKNMATFANLQLTKVIRFYHFVVQMYTPFLEN